MDQSNLNRNIPAVFEITFLKRHGFFELTKEFTAFEEEEEVLVQDGLEYSIIDNSESLTDCGRKFYLIKVQYPAV